MGKLGNVQKMMRAQAERIGTGEKYAARVRLVKPEQVLFGLVERVVEPGLRLEQVCLHRLQGRPSELEGQILIERAELALAVRASCRRLDDERVRLVGRPPDGSV